MRRISNPNDAVNGPSNNSIAKNVFRNVKRFYDWADPVLGPVNTGLESLSAIGFVVSMSFSDYAVCQQDLLKNPDNASINNELRWIFLVIGLFSTALGAADGFKYTQDENYKTYWLTRIKSMLLGMYSGGVLSDQALIGIFDITNCPTILASNSAAMLALGGARFVSYTHSNVPVRYLKHLRAANRSDELLVTQPTGKMKILKALASILVAGSTGLAVYHSGYALVTGDYPPKYGRNIFKLITGLLFGACGLGATLLDNKHPEAAFRWKQFIIVLSEATLIERGLNAVYDLDNSPYDTIASPIMTIISLFSAITKANREVPVHRIRQELELQRLNAGLGSEAPMTAVHVDVGSPTPISLSPQWAQPRSGNGSPGTGSSGSGSPGSYTPPRRAGSADSSPTLAAVSVGSSGSDTSVASDAATPRAADDSFTRVLRAQPLSHGQRYTLAFTGAAAPQTGTLDEPLLQSGHPSEAVDASLLSFG